MPTTRLIVIQLLQGFQVCSQGLQDKPKWSKWAICSLVSSDSGYISRSMIDMENPFHKDLNLLVRSYWRKFGDLTRPTPKALGSQKGGHFFLSTDNCTGEQYFKYRLTKFCTYHLSKQNQPRLPGLVQGPGGTAREDRGHDSEPRDGGLFVHEEEWALFLDLFAAVATLT